MEPESEWIGNIAFGTSGISRQASGERREPYLSCDGDVCLCGEDATLGHKHPSRGNIRACPCCEVASCLP